FPLHHHEAAGEPGRQPRQMHPREHQMRRRRADIDPDRRQFDIVRRPDRLTDFARFGRVVDVNVLEFQVVHHAASSMNLPMPDVTPCLASSARKILWMRGSWFSYSIWQPPSLTLTSIPMNTRFLSAVNG